MEVIIPAAKKIVRIKWNIDLIGAATLEAPGQSWLLCLGPDTDMFVALFPSIQADSIQIMKVGIYLF